jgi:hypothetical protein
VWPGPLVVGFFLFFLLNFVDVVTGNQTGDDDPQEDLATFDYCSTLVGFGIN